jgi:hypothetical protein
MIWKARFKGDFIAAIEFGDKTPTLTIAKIETVKLEQEDGKNKDKAVIWFKEIPRGWVYCKTTGFCMAAMFGEDDANWIGKRVTLFSEIVQVGRERAPGIRVKGSPDIDKPVKVSIKLPRKKAFTVVLRPTAKNAGNSLPAQPDPPIDETPPVEEPIQSQDDPGFVEERA